MIQKFVSENETSIGSSSIVLSSNIQKYFGPGEETVYVKGRITIIDSSTLEIAIFVTEFRGKLAVDKYRLHYMNGSGQMLFAMIMPHIIQKLLLILIKNTHLTE